MSLATVIIALKGGANSGNHGHAGRPGTVGGSVGGNSSMSSIVTRKDLRAVNDGIGAVGDDIPGTEENFYDKCLVPLHNANSTSKLLQFANSNPEAYAKFKTVMQYDMWDDQGKKGTFDKFINSDVKVYRGVQSASDINTSWTTDRHSAQNFALFGANNNYRSADEANLNGKVLTSTIKPRDIIAYSDAQGEKEVIANVSNWQEESVGEYSRGGKRLI
jgi:hypothetical protein